MSTFLCTVEKSHDRLGISPAEASSALDTEDDEVWVEKSLSRAQESTLPWRWFSALLGIRLFYQPPICLSLSLCSRYLAVFTLNVVPLHWIPINSFYSTVARNSILQALNHRPSEKVWELQILRSPLLNPGSYGSKGAHILCWLISFPSFALSLYRAAWGSLTMCYFFLLLLFWCCCQAPPHACNH